jgi:hypothetical protein
MPCLGLNSRFAVLINYAKLSIPFRIAGGFPLREISIYSSYYSLANSILASALLFI